MTAAFGISWNDGKNRAVAAAVALFVASGLLMMTPTQTRALSDSTSALVRVLVQRSPGAGEAPERAVQQAGGRVVQRVDLVNGLVAEVPEASVPSLETAPGVEAVLRDRGMHAESTDDPTAAAPATAASTAGNSLSHVADVTGASKLQAQGVTGRGVDVAVIDSGIAPVPALAGAGKVVNGADLSPDAWAAGQKFLDGFGHGTHMAGIIGGRDDATGFKGIAPDSRIVNVKAADHSG